MIAIVLQGYPDDLTGLGAGVMLINGPRSEVSVPLFARPTGTPYQFPGWWTTPYPASFWTTAIYQSTGVMDSAGREIYALVPPEPAPQQMTALTVVLGEAIAVGATR